MDDTRRYTRYAEKKAGTHNKFYEVEVVENEDGPSEMFFRWGRIGTKGVEKRSTGSFSFLKNVAQNQFDKKLDKGYREVSAMEALASACQDPSERKLRGYKPVTIEIPFFEAGHSEERCQSFCKKYLDKLNLIRGSRHDLSDNEYYKQIHDLQRAYKREWNRMCESRTHGNLKVNRTAWESWKAFGLKMVSVVEADTYQAFWGGR